MNGYIVLYPNQEKWYVEIERLAFHMATIVCPFCLLFAAAFQIWLYTPVTGQQDGLISIYGVARQKDVKELKEQISMLPEWAVEAYQKEGNIVYLSSVPLTEFSNESWNKKERLIGLHKRKNDSSTIWVLNTEGAIEKATLHEFGHFIDAYFWERLNTSKFQEYYEQEKDIFLEMDGNKHNTSSPSEFLRSVFCGT